MSCRPLKLGEPASGTRVRCSQLARVVGFISGVCEEGPGNQVVSHSAPTRRKVDW